MQRFAIATIILAGITSAACGANPSVESAAPGVGQRGTEFTLKFIGTGLTDQSEVVFYKPGVTCVGVKSTNDTELAVTVKAAADCPLGSHPFRVRTKNGLSEMRVFRVTPLPVLASTEPNESIQQAMPIEQNVTVTGVLESADVDCFELTLKKGEYLAAEVEAVRLGVNLVDTVLTVFGPDGKQIAQADDTCLYGQDPFLSVVAPADGKYVVKVHEAAMEGDENSRYALHVGTFARPAFMLPPGGPAGQSLAVKFFGDARGTFEQKVALPQTPDANFGVYAEQAGISTPTAIPFRVSPFGNVIENEQNEDGSASTEAPELPIAFNGILDKPSDIDHFRFRMTAGEVMEFEAFAERLGSRADTLISILDNAGTLLVRNDDDGSHDSRLLFQAPSTGEFQLQVLDKRGSSGPDFFYRVEASSPNPELTAFLPRPNRVSQERQTISVPRGNRVMTFLGVRRAGGVNGPVTLEALSLPAGVSSPAATIAEDQFITPVVIEAAADAPIAGSLVQMKASGAAKGNPVTGGFQQVVDLVAGSADTLYQSTTVDRLAVAVVEPAPFSVRIEEPKTGLAQDGTLSLTIHVDRAADFTKPLEITFPYLPPWIDCEPKLTIPADHTTGVYIIHAFPQAKPRSWPLCVEARPGVAERTRESLDADLATQVAQGYRGRRRGRGGSDAVVSSQIFALNIVPSPVSGEIGKVAAEQGTQLKLVSTIDRQRELPSSLVATLEGLPNRVSVSPITISADDKKVEFLVKFEATAPLGSFNSMVCRLTGKVDGQEVSYCVGRGGVLKIEPSGALVTDKDGRPLSPLEVLRQSQKKVTTPAPTGSR